MVKSELTTINNHRSSTTPPRFSSKLPQNYLKQPVPFPVFLLKSPLLASFNLIARKTTKSPLNNQNNSTQTTSKPRPQTIYNHLRNNQQIRSNPFLLFKFLFVFQVYELQPPWNCKIRAPNGIAMTPSISSPKNHHGSKRVQIFINEMQSTKTTPISSEQSRITIAKHSHTEEHQQTPSSIMTRGLTKFKSFIFHKTLISNQKDKSGESLAMRKIITDDSRGWS